MTLFRNRIYWIRRFSLRETNATTATIKLIAGEFVLVFGLSMDSSRCSDAMTTRKFDGFDFIGAFCWEVVDFSLFLPISSKLPRRNVRWPQWLSWDLRVTHQWTSKVQSNKSWFMLNPEIPPVFTTDRQKCCNDTTGVGGVCPAPGGMGQFHRLVNHINFGNHLIELCAKEMTWNPRPRQHALRFPPITPTKIKLSKCDEILKNHVKHACTLGLQSVSDSRCTLSN